MVMAWINSWLMTVTIEHEKLLIDNYMAQCYLLDFINTIMVISYCTDYKLSVTFNMCLGSLNSF